MVEALVPKDEIVEADATPIIPADRIVDTDKDAIIPKDEIVETEIEDVEKPAVFIDKKDIEAYITTKREMNPLLNLAYHAYDFLKDRIENSSMSTVLNIATGMVVEHTIDSVKSALIYDKYNNNPQEFLEERARLTSEVSNSPFLRGFYDDMFLGELSRNDDIQMTGDPEEQTGNAVGALVRDVVGSLFLPGGFITSIALGNGVTDYNKSIGAGYDTIDAMKIGVASGVASGAGAYIGFKTVPLAMNFALKPLNRFADVGLVRVGTTALNGGSEFVGWDASQHYIQKGMNEIMKLPDDGSTYNFNDVAHSFATGVAFSTALPLLGKILSLPLKTGKKYVEKYADKKLIDSIFDDMEHIDSNYIMSGRELETTANAVRSRVRAGVAPEDALREVLNEIDKKGLSKDNITRIVTELGDIL